MIENELLNDQINSGLVPAGHIFSDKLNNVIIQDLAVAFPAVGMMKCFYGIPNTLEFDATNHKTESFIQLMLKFLEKH